MELLFLASILLITRQISDILLLFKQLSVFILTIIKNYKQTEYAKKGSELSL